MAPSRGHRGYDAKRLGDGRTPTFVVPSNFLGRLAGADPPRPIAIARARERARKTDNMQPNRRLVVFARLNLALFLAEFSAGVLLSSLGLVSDSLHQLVNCMGVGLSLLAHQANMRRTKIRGYSYGTERVEVLAAFANSVFLVLLVRLVAVPGANVAPRTVQLRCV